ncbi:MAG: FTR1 family protein [Solirubrobacteraceae bacterium]
MRRGLRTLLLVALLGAVSLAGSAPTGARAADGPPAWQAADTIRAALFDAQSAALVGDRAEARRGVARARRALRGELRDATRGQVGADLRGALRDAGRAADAGDAVALAAARGRATSGAHRVSMDRTLRALRDGDAQAAHHWLLLRDYRVATRYSSSPVDATIALRNLRAGRTDAGRATLIVTKDLYDAYQSQLRVRLKDAEQGARRRFGTRQAEALGHARGLWAILRARFVEERSAEGADEVDRLADAMVADAVAGRFADAGRDAKAFEAALDGFVAAPFTPEEQARRASQLLRFVELVPIEYRDGTEDGRVTVDFEMQEAKAFVEGADAAFADIGDALRRRDADAHAKVHAGLERLDKAVADAIGGGEVIDEDDVKAIADDTVEALRDGAPDEWTASSDDSDFDLIALTLDRLETAVAAGAYGQAEQARLEAYAFFEFGPELRLQPFDPGLVGDIEGLVWFGARDVPGLAQLIARKAPPAQVKETRRVMDDALADARATLGDDQSAGTVITNAALIVFREGLEAVLILAAITASFVGAASRKRRPVLIGAAFGLLASAITWVIAAFILDQFTQYGEKLEAIVGVIAIGVLLLVMNWFFHKVYWTQWISGFNQRKRQILADEEAGLRTGFWTTQVFGFGMLGLTSVYREGFETVLFLQSLQLSSGLGVVLAGVALGGVFVAAVAVATFAMQRKLPYKRMLIFTMVLLALVLVILVGQTARTFQGVGWLPIHPVDVDIPYWMGTWLGVHPTVETLGLQLVAGLSVLGSYFAAEWWKVKRPQRKARRRRAADAVEAVEVGGSIQPAETASVVEVAD